MVQAKDEQRSTPVISMPRLRACACVLALALSCALLAVPAAASARRQPSSTFSAEANVLVPAIVATSVSEVSVAANVTAAGASDVAYTATFKAEHALESDEGYVRLTAPQGVTFAANSGLYAVIDGEHANVANGGVVVGPEGLGENVVDVYIPDNFSVAAGDTVEVQAYGASNPASEEPSGTFSVATSADTAPVSKPLPIGPAGGVEDVSVSANTTAAGASEVEYTASFKATDAIGDGNPYWFHEAPGFVQLTAPKGAVFSANGGFYEVSDGEHHELPNGVTVSPGGAGQNVVDVYIPGGFSVAAGDTVEVRAWGVSNPSSEEASGAFSVASSSDVLPVSKPLAIGPAGGVEDVSVSANTTASGASDVEYTASFTATDAISDGNSIWFHEAPGFVQLTAPKGAVFSANGGFYEVSDGEHHELPNGVTVSPGGAGQNVVDVYLPGGFSVAAGDTVEVRAWGVSNPSSEEASGAFSVASSSDVLPVSKPLAIGPAGGVKDASVHVNASSADASEAEYTASFTATDAISDGNTIWFHEAPGFVQLTAPTGTVFAKSQVFYEVSDGEHHELAAGVAVSPGGAGENVVDVYVPGGVPVAAGDSVEVRAYGVSNPASEEASASASVATSSDVTAASQPLAIGPATAVAEASAGVIEGSFSESFTTRSPVTNGNALYFDEGSGFVELTVSGGSLPKEAYDYHFEVSSVGGSGQRFEAASVHVDGDTAMIHPAQPIGAGDRVQLLVSGLAGAEGSLVSTSSDAVQVSTGTVPLAPISGTVTAEGQPAPNASVQACRVGGACTVVSSDERGNFQLAVAAEAATYQLTASPPPAGVGSRAGIGQATVSISGAAGASGVNIALGAEPKIAKGITIVQGASEQTSATSQPFLFWGSPYELKLEPSFFPSAKRIVVTKVIARGTNWTTGEPQQQVVDVGGSVGGLPTGLTLGDEPISVEMPPSEPIHGEETTTVDYRILRGSATPVSGVASTGVLDESYPSSGEPQTDPLAAYFVNYGNPSGITVGAGEITGADADDFKIVPLSGVASPKTSTDCGASSVELQQFTGGSGSPPANTECGIGVSFTPPAQPLAYKIYYFATLKVPAGAGTIPVSLIACDAQVAQENGVRCFQGAQGPGEESAWGPKRVGRTIAEVIAELKAETLDCRIVIGDELREEPVEYCLGSAEQEAGEVIIEEEEEGEEEEEEEGGGAYHDPSGAVYTTASNGHTVPLDGAIVMLAQSLLSEGPFTQVPEGSTIMSPGNRVDPTTTGAEGLFGWDVLAGYYQITASKEGCESQSTPVLTVPPPVTGLSLTLSCASPPALKATTTTLSSSASESPYGAPVKLTAKVEGGSSPTGTVTFKEGTTTLGSGTVQTGEASLTLTTLTPGEHTITAAYGGDGANEGSTSKAFTQTITSSSPPPGEQPVIGSLSVHIGSTAGGAKVTIKGQHLEGATAVHFGDALATELQVVSTRVIKVKSPAHAAETVDVTVTTPTGGTSTTDEADRFTYVVAPTVSAVTPSRGPAAGGTPVTIAGTNLDDVDSVSFGKTPAQSFEVTSQDTIAAVTPAGSPSVAAVTVAVGPVASAKNAAAEFRYLPEAPPSLGRCVSTGEGGGEYAAGCTVRRAGGGYEWLSGPGGKPGFSAANGASTIETVHKQEIACTGERTAGEWAGAKLLTAVTLTLTGCQLQGAACTSAGAPSGELDISGLEGTLGWEVEEHDAVAIDLYAAARGAQLASATCAASAVTLAGSVLAPIVPVNRMTEAFTVKYGASKGIQKPEHLEGEANDVLELSLAGSPFEQAGLTIRSQPLNEGEAGRTKTTLTGEEALEINTVL
ncbi:MAG TPA: IPT/TIG domain-containing protein [Solirubrobacteraceae bacterium]|nr:IPT/TIG domain-containing protein [Solirubrobacteraceae bacterium]